jgi:GNAT superfamily N-acetyltransferase
MGGANQFSCPISVDPGLFSYEPFKELGQVRNFSCGEPDLDAFLNSEEVEEYERESLGRTFLAYYNGALAGYYTISTDGLRLEYIQSRKYPKSHVKRGKELVETVPSLKIGRLAVHTEFQGKGVGRILIRRISAIATLSVPAVRLLVVNSKEKSIPFYTKCGFRFTLPVGHERGRKLRTMYLDLLGVEKEICSKEP